MDMYFYDCYDENFKWITQGFYKDPNDLLEKVPNVKYILCIDIRHGRCFKQIDANGVGIVVNPEEVRLC